MEDDLNPNADQLKEEQEGLAEAKEEIIRAGVAEALGLADDDTNKDILDRAVKREMESRKKLSTVIGQKIKYRELAKAGKPAAAAEVKTLDAEAIRKAAADDVSNRFNEEFLEDSGLSDELKGQIREWSKFKGVTAKAASKTPHIATAIEAFKKTQKNNEAAGNGSGEGRSGTDGKDGMPAKFNDAKFMASPDGQKEFDAWDKTRGGK